MKGWWERIGPDKRILVTVLFTCSPYIVALAVAVIYSVVWEF